VQLLAVLLGSVAALAAIALFARVRIALDVQGRGEPSGHWLAAFGVELGPWAVTGVAARGVPSKLELHALGQRFDLTHLVAPEPDGSGRATRSAPARTEGSLFGDPVALLGLALDERCRFQIEQLRVEIGFGFRDIALTGKLLGALYMVSGVLPARMILEPRPRWDGAESFELGARGTVAVWPGLALTELLWYMLRRRARRARQPPEPLAALP